MLFQRNCFPCMTKKCERKPFEIDEIEDKQNKYISGYKLLTLTSVKIKLDQRQNTVAY